MSDTQTTPTPLVTPAMQHDSEFPKPKLELGINNTIPMFKQVQWANDALQANELVLPKGDYITALSPQSAQIFAIHLSLANFNSSTGLGVLNLKTASDFNEVQQVAFFLNDDFSFNFIIKANHAYSFVMALSMSAYGGTVPVLINVIESPL